MNRQQQYREIFFCEDILRKRVPAKWLTTQTPCQYFADTTLTTQTPMVNFGGVSLTLKEQSSENNAKVC